MREVFLFGFGGLAVLAATLVVAGMLRTTHIVTITRTTSATPDQIWQLWADVPGRTRWDEGLESIRLDGAFEAGAGGEVTLKGQPAVRFEIRECEPGRHYTDRFFLPGGTTMDWQHLIDDRGHDTRAVTFRITAKGPTSLPLTPVMKRILGKDLPPTVDRLIALAEAAPAGR